MNRLPEPQFAPRPPRAVSIIIPTFNTRDLIERHLPRVLAAAAAYSGPAEVVVADDGGTDGTAEWVPDCHPEVRVVRNERNLGFGRTVNRAVSGCVSEIVFLLNSDVEVGTDFVLGLARHFEDPALFAVSPRALVPAIGMVNESPTRASFAGGLFRKVQPAIQEGKNPILPCSVLHAPCGYSAFRREMFLAMGGLDPIYEPFLWEDVDLGYRAWKRGWKVLHDPSIEVLHHSHRTIGKVAKRERLDAIEIRNQLLFTWRNIGDPWLLAQHMGFLAKVAGGAVLGSPVARAWLRALREAAPRLPAALMARMRERRGYLRRDREVIGLCDNQPDAAACVRTGVAARAAAATATTSASAPPPGPAAGAGSGAGPRSRPEGRPRVLLVDPPGWQRGVNVGIGYLATALGGAGFGCAVLDLNNLIGRMPPQVFARLCGDGGFDLVGFSVKTATLGAAAQLSRALAEDSPRIVQIAGGPHPTLVPADFLRENPSFQHVAIGEAEGTLVEFCERLRRGEPPAGMSGVASAPTLPGGEVVLGPPAPSPADLDTLSPPEYGFLPDGFFGASGSEYPLVTSRGCPHACSFCAVPRVSGRRWRRRRAEAVVAELAAAKERFGIRRFNILDDNFTQDIDHAKAVCRLLIEENLGLGWACGNGIRADRVDEELAALMRQAGCSLVCVGVESADPAVFSTIGKRESLEEIARGARLLKLAGIEVVGFFIIGLPGDTFERTARSLDFMKEKGLDSARWGILLPYPGVAVWDQIRAKGRWVRDWRDGSHFGASAAPVFETDSFSASEMARAYEMLNTKLGLFWAIEDASLLPLERKIRRAKLLWKYDRPRLWRALKGFLAHETSRRQAEL